MAITFQSNQTVNGTTANDSMVGTQTGGNFNDIVYGHQGDDTITSQNGISNSNLFGGQGNDVIDDFSGGISQTVSGNAIYGNLGNDILESIVAKSDSLFGGQGNDQILNIETQFDQVYGNQGNDSLTSEVDANSTLFGGQGNDGWEGLATNNDQIYGNQGNDQLFAAENAFNDHMYGGMGADTLSFTGRFGGTTFNDVETGGLGNDVFAADNGSGVFGNGSGRPLSASDIVTVTDFLQGSDKLTETTMGGVGFTSVSAAGANAAQALTAADNFYNSAGHSGREYVFVYGGTAAGYLFYNGDGGGTFARSGMAIDGAVNDGNVVASDIIVRPSNA